MDAVGFPVRCRDGGEGDAGQCVYGEYLYLRVCSDDGRGREGLRFGAISALRRWSC